MPKINDMESTLFRLKLGAVVVALIWLISIDFVVMLPPSGPGCCTHLQKKLLLFIELVGLPYVNRRYSNIKEKESFLQYLGYSDFCTAPPRWALFPLEEFIIEIWHGNKLLSLLNVLLKVNKTIRSTY